MRKSILDAVKMGFWDYEPPEVDADDYDHTEAMPGTNDKLEVLANRVKSGLPLWHPNDRNEADEEEFRRNEAKRLESAKNTMLL